MEAGGQRHVPVPLPLGVTLFPFYRRLFRSQVRSGQVRKGSPPPRFDPQAIQPVASRYTDCTIPVHICGISILSNVSKNPLERLGKAYKLRLFWLWVQTLGLKEDMGTLVCLACSLLHAYRENMSPSPVPLRITRNLQAWTVCLKYQRLFFFRYQSLFRNPTLSD